MFRAAVTAEIAQDLSERQKIRNSVDASYRLPLKVWFFFVGHGVGGTAEILDVRKTLRTRAMEHVYRRARAPFRVVGKLSPGRLPLLPKARGG